MGPGDLGDPPPDERGANRLATAVGRARRRVIAGAFRIARLPADRGATSTFALAIMRRYASRQVVQPVIQMILRRNLPAVTLRSSYGHVHVTPRFALTVVTEQATGPVEAAPSGRLTSRPRAHRLIDTFVQRLIGRKARTDSLPVVGPSVGGRVVASVSTSMIPALARQVPRIVYRGPSREVSDYAGEAPRVATPSADAERAPWPPRPHPAESPRPSAVPDVDIGHLTDRVVQAIDRRIIAYRERLGRR